MNEQKMAPKEPGYYWAKCRPWGGLRVQSKWQPVELVAWEDREPFVMTIGVGGNGALADVEEWGEPVR